MNSYVRRGGINQSRAKASSRGFSEQGRVKILALFFVIFSLVVVGRLFDLQILRGHFYSALAFGQHELYQKLFPERGSIYVVEESGTNQTLFPLVANQDLNMLYAVPALVEKPAELAEALYKILGLPFEPDLEEVEKEIFADISPDLEFQMAFEIKEARMEEWWETQEEEEIKRLTTILSKKNDPYEPIRHRLSDETVREIEALEYEGLGFSKETWRYYPEKGVGGHIFGFWGFDNSTRRGKYGLEGRFEVELAGRPGEISSERDVWGNLISAGVKSIKEKVDGSDLVLTINRAIQYKTCQALYSAIERFEAESGSVIVMEPKTGAILAMCGFPDYDLDEYNKVENIDVYNNPAIFNAYEPGSIFKPITIAAALDAGKITPQTTYEDYGSVTIGKDTIRNYEQKVHGVSTMTDVLEKSINTGTVWAMKRVTSKVFIKYVKDFGFGQKTGIELDMEAGGDITNLNRRSEIYAATASYGHGITVTPIQMTAAVSAIANGGKLMKPYIVSQKITEIKNEKKVETYDPQVVRQVISSESARTLSAMMVNVVESSHGSAAKVPGYRVAGKTGTALVASETGGYSGDVITSFVGFAPFANPRFTILVRIDKPQKGKLGATVAAPVFNEIAKFVLQYYNVPTDE
jgi:cell division protein FtsI/penicillin-binding protein 2